MLTFTTMLTFTPRAVLTQRLGVSLRLALVLVGLAGMTTPATAQFISSTWVPLSQQYWNQQFYWNQQYYFWNQPAFPQPAPIVGVLPNGTPIANPWAMYRGTNAYALPIAPVAWHNQFVAYQQAMIWNPSLNPYLGFNDAWTATNGMIQNAVAFNRPVQLEPGRFLPVAPGLNLNPVTGTVLNNRLGVAYTNEGPYLRLPNTGSITPWGTYLPGSGVYVNPFTGSAYNPATGLIVR